MKTAISIPDEIFVSADMLAKRLGISRSELYATAVSEYVQRSRADKVTDRLNEVYSTEDSSLDPDWPSCSIEAQRSVVVKRGELWWANLPEPQGSGPGYRRPVLIVSSDSFNDSRISTVIVAAITSNARLAMAPGNVALSSRANWPVQGFGGECLTTAHARSDFPLEADRPGDVPATDRDRRWHAPRARPMSCGRSSRNRSEASPERHLREAPQLPAMQLLRPLRAQQLHRAHPDQQMLIAPARDRTRSPFPAA